MKKPWLFVISAFMLLCPQVIGSSEQKPVYDVNKLKTYVINLDRLIDKYEPLKNQLLMYELQPTRFAAVDGYNLRIKDKKGDAEFTGRELVNNTQELRVDHNYHIQCPARSVVYAYDSKLVFRPLTAGELGCYCSHLGVYTDIVATNQDASLILEDDAILGERFIRHIKDVLTHSPQDWDIIYLYIRFSKPATKAELLNQKFIPIDNSYLQKIRADKVDIRSTVAMLISYKGAQKILATLDRFSAPIDNHLNELINQGQLNAYKTIESYVLTIDGPSEIQKMGRHKYYRDYYKEKKKL